VNCDPIAFLPALNSAGALPPWTIFIPGVLIVPIAYVITYASTTFITPSPIEIPIDIWSRYLFYLPGSIMWWVSRSGTWNKFFCRTFRLMWSWDCVLGQTLWSD
jgi:hypothetical protein